MKRGLKYWVTLWLNYPRLIIKPGKKFAHPDDVKVCTELIHRHFSGELPYYESESRMKHKDGHWVWIQDRGQIVTRNSDGKPLMMFGIHIDITERKQAESKAVEIVALKQSNTAKTELLTNVSHELRTPLASIKGFIETLLQPDIKWSRQQQRDFLTTANHEADHLTLLIRNLLDMSRIESGKLLIDKQLYTIESIFDSSDAGLKDLTRNHKLVIDIPPGIPPFPHDNMRIAQVPDQSGGKCC